MISVRRTSSRSASSGCADASEPRITNASAVAVRTAALLMWFLLEPSLMPGSIQQPSGDLFRVIREDEWRRMATAIGSGHGDLVGTRASARREPLRFERSPLIEGAGATCGTQQGGDQASEVDAKGQGFSRGSTTPRATAISLGRLVPILVRAVEPRGRTVPGFRYVTAGWSVDGHRGARLKIGHRGRQRSPRS